MNRLFIVAIFLALIAFPRVFSLGFSHFYGDETKVLYLDKTKPAVEFLLDQRKGPVQFLVAWVVEKISGGYSEFWMRLPFAFAGFLAVFAFYFLVKQLLGNKVATVSVILYAFSGFSVAFSRTLQYQSFLQLFGFLALYFFVRYTQENKRNFLLISYVFYTLAFLTHYDSIFYFIPALFLLDKSRVKDFSKILVLPSALILSAFYIPYLSKGYFVQNTLGYLSKRIIPTAETLPNSSIYTFLVYNPFIFYGLLLVTGLLLALLFYRDSLYRSNLRFFFIWLALPLFTFEVIFKSPGTHIMQYFVPMYALAGFGLITLYERLNYKSLRVLVAATGATVIAVQILYSYLIFIPNNLVEYPWKASKLGVVNLRPANKEYQLFLYGFPYNRNWTQIADFLNSQEGARGFYTNDNAVVGKYYVKKLDITEPRGNFYPQYYVLVFNSQELRYPDQEFLTHYFKIREQSGVYEVYKRVN